jgi:GTP-binding protein EngB required for normal cell division
MIQRTNFSLILLACFSLNLLNASVISTAHAEPDITKDSKQKSTGKISGKVTEVIDVPGYTYAEVDTGKQKVWAAGPPTALKTGDTITFSSQMPMQNFHSKSLGRDFPLIYFITQYDTGTEGKATATSHDQIKQQQTSKPVDGINKVEGGYTIAEIYADKQNLDGKIIRVRGKVTKYTPEIMGKNWLHIKDSSTFEDLTVTTINTAAVGDIVIAEGKLEVGKDYGSNYFYPVIMEDATVTKE